MTEISIIASIVAAIGLGAMSPGPSFLLVARTTAQSRSQGVVAAVGMGVGGMLFALIALAGLHVILTQVPTIYMAVRVVGALYLIYLGFKIIKGAKSPFLTTSGLETNQKNTHWKALGVGLATQLSNPKTAVVYASVFTSLLPAAFSLTFGFFLVFLVFLIEAGWYVIVALVLSSAKLRQGYLQRKVIVDVLAGAIMMILGGKLIFNLF
jgi:threonine/homoserine/homoserine lactone efflux protein